METAFRAGDSQADAHADRNPDHEDFYAVLLGMAGHDLRQPLQVLQSAYDWLYHHHGQGPTKVHLDRGQRAISLITQQFDRLIAALRLHEQTSRMAISPVPLAPLLDRIVEENSDLARTLDVDLRLSETRAVVISNEVVLDGIVRNLVHNAIKHTPPGHHVLVGCRRLGGHTRIDIWDSGIGMNAHQVPAVFEAFQRLDSTHPNGLGLGLFVVRRAVALLGHRIEVRSRIGKGSRFSIIARRAAT